MKTNLLFTTLAWWLVSVHALAAIGKTSAETASLYGPPTAAGVPRHWWDGWADSGRDYEYQGAKVRVFFKGGVSVCEFWDFAEVPSTARIQKVLNLHKAQAWHPHGDVFMTWGGRDDEKVPKGTLAASLMGKRTLMIAEVESFMNAALAFKKARKENEGF